jgi:hypothetical protein
MTRKKTKRDIKWPEKKPKEILNDQKKNKRDIKWPEKNQKRY